MDEPCPPDGGGTISRQAPRTADPAIINSTGESEKEMRTYVPKQGDIEPRWHLIDAEGLVLGRLCTEVARILSGKNKPTWTPFLDTGDHVIVINADKIVLTGQKADKKLYHRHSGYPGALRTTTAKVMLAEKPTFAIEKAVKGMLPKSRLGRKMIKKLKVYAGSEHPHQAQQPETVELAK